MIKVIECKGCRDHFYEWQVTEDGYCYSCQYEHEQKLDNQTGNDDE